jgi:uncharacterized protein YceK
MYHFNPACSGTLKYVVKYYTYLEVTMSLTGCGTLVKSHCSLEVYKQSYRDSSLEEHTHTGGNAGRG